MAPMTRDEWLAERRKTLGASDAPVFCGLVPSKLRLYLDKTGQLGDEKPAPEMEWGLRHEPAIADAYAERTGHHVSVPAEPIAYHKTVPWMAASLDRERDDGRIVELKFAPYSGRDWGADGTDEVPAKYLVQTHQQMAVKDKDAADVAALIAGCDFRIYTIRRNEGLIRYLTEQGDRFWEALQKRQPPPADPDDPDAARLLGRLHRAADGVVRLDNGIEMLVAEYEHLAGEIGRQEKARKRLKAQILQAMTTHAVGILPSGGRLERRQITRRGYTVGEASYWDLRIRGTDHSTQLGG